MRNRLTSAEHRHASALTAELQALTEQILDARLALSRLRNQYPAPRLSMATAEATLESQTEKMASLDAELSETNIRVEDTKNAVQDIAREVERLKVERAAKEIEARETKGEEEDDRIVGLYDW